MKRGAIIPDRMVEIDPKGIPRPIDVCERRGTVLYIDRRFEDHPTIDRLRAWHFPDLGWRVCVYEGHDGPWWCDWYVDIARFTEGGGRIEILDLYADVAVHEGRSYEVLDLDELAEALDRGEISAADTAWALLRTQRLCNLLQESGFSMAAVLGKALRGEIRPADDRAEGSVSASSRKGRHGAKDGPGPDQGPKRAAP